MSSRAFRYRRFKQRLVAVVKTIPDEKMAVRALVYLAIEHGVSHEGLHAFRDAKDARQLRRRSNLRRTNARQKRLAQRAWNRLPAWQRQMQQALTVNAGIFAAVRMFGAIGGRR